MKATLIQQRALTALGLRTGKAMRAELWDDTDLAERRLLYTKSWRAYRKRHPR